jgi:hypothetical protein
VPSAKLEGKKDVQKMFADAGDGFAQVATTYKGTPWEVLAKRSLGLPPSARWEAIVPPKGGK